MVEAADICGVAAALGQGFACSTGEGRFLTGRRREVRIGGLAFDNHLVRI